MFLFIALNIIVLPIWEDWSNHDSLYGFYEQPKDTIQTLFLGSSVVVNGIIPMELYENYGICAYNLGTEQQPMISSYSWLRETHRLHKNSLKTVVLDVSMLRRQPDEAFFLKSIIPMKNTSIKRDALIDYYIDNENMFKELVPVFRYHSRWKELRKTDFNFDLGEPQVKKYLRGYNYDASLAILNGNFEAYDSLFPIYTVQNDNVSQLDKTSLYYCNKIIEFCRGNGLTLVFIKTPLIWWGGNDSNAVSEIAALYDIPFIDFNLVPTIDEIGYNCALDSADTSHLNYYGAKKLSEYIGQFLIDNDYADDIRGRDTYAFMDQELEDYQKYVVKLEKLHSEANPTEYIKLARDFGNSIVIISVHDDAAGTFDDYRRSEFKELNLDALSQIQFADSYVGVIIDGSTVYEDSKIYEPADAPQNDIQAAELHSDSADNDMDRFISYTDTYQGTKFTVKSGGLNTNSPASIVFNNAEYSLQRRGLNIVVYDYQQRCMIDSANFDTCAYYYRIADLGAELENRIANNDYNFERGSDLDRLYRYNRKCFNKRITNCAELEDNELTFLLDSFNKERDYTIILTVKDDGVAALDKDSREYLKDMGLDSLSDLNSGNSYIGLVESGHVILDQADHEASPVVYEAPYYMIQSGGIDSGSMASVIIDGVEQLPPDSTGLNLVIYDEVIQQVVAVRSF